MPTPNEQNEGNAAGRKTEYLKRRMDAEFQRGIAEGKREAMRIVEETPLPKNAKGTDAASMRFLILSRLAKE